MVVFRDEEQPQETSSRIIFHLTFKDRGEVNSCWQKSGENIKPREFPELLTSKAFYGFGISRGVENIHNNVFNLFFFFFRNTMSHQMK